MPSSRASNYPKWDFTFDEYWSIDNHQERQQKLLDYFVLCRTISAKTSDLTLDVLYSIVQDDVFCNPFKIGLKSVHNEKKLYCLRQCIVAEGLFLCGNKKQMIGKNLVTRNTDRYKEQEWIDNVKSLVGDINLDLCVLSTPRSKYLTEKKYQKMKMSSEPSSCSGPYSNIIHSSTGKDDLNVQMPLIHNNRNQIFPRKRVVGSGVSLSWSTATSRSGCVIQTNDCDHNLPLTPRRVSFDCSDQSNCNNNLHGVKFDEVENKKCTTMNDEGASHVLYYEDIDPDCMITGPSKRHIVSSSNDVTHYVEEEEDLESFYLEDVMYSPLSAQHREEYFPEISADCSSFTKYGLEWKNILDSSKSSTLTRDTIGRKANQIVTLLHKISNGNTHVAEEILQNLERRLQKCSIKISNEQQIIDSTIVYNIEKFLTLPQLRSKGHRNAQVQQAVLAILSSVVGPTYGYYSTPYGQGANVCVDKSRSVYTIVFNWGGILYAHEKTVQTYRLSSGTLSIASLGRLISIVRQNSRLFHTCQNIRNTLEAGKENPFENIITNTNRKKRWDNFDEEMKKAVYAFCHDPDHVRPDNYCRYTYACEDASGKKCHHQRHNWMINGNLFQQYDIFMQSIYFSSLLDQLQKKNHQRNITEEYVTKKMSFRKFRSFKSNCVREETRASCVDPIEARCYDSARALQLAFRGFLSTKPRLQRIYLQEHNDIDTYDPFINDYSSDVDQQEDGSDEEDVSTTVGGTDSSAAVGQELEHITSANDLLDKFKDCTCIACLTGHGWLDIFGSMKGSRPHREMVDIVLCPQIVYPDISIEGERPFTLHKWNCAHHECQECGIDKCLPFDCPVINSEYKIKIWVWSKSTGDNECTSKTVMAIKDVFKELRDSLYAFTSHSISLQLFNRMRYMNLRFLGFNRVQICTDFSSQIDLEPIRKLSCHVNKHGSLGVFCVFFNTSELIDGEEVKYLACHEWFILGGCNDKGKQNDWVFHNAAVDYIIGHYSKTHPQLQICDVWTDNCPGQYKCRQNFFQLAKKTTKHQHLQEYNHNFAKQHGFKNKCDTISHWLKAAAPGVKVLERDIDMFAGSMMMYYHLANQHLENNQSKLERMLNGEKDTIQLEHLKKCLLEKSPYESTKRLVAFMADKESTVKDLRSQMPDGHFIFSDRDRMEKEEDTRPIENTTSYYSFSHKKEDDNIVHQETIFNANADPIINNNTNNEHYCCRHCSLTYKQRIAFLNHERLCKLIVESGKGHKIRFKHFMCHCLKCQSGNFELCVFGQASGTEKIKWLVCNEVFHEIENQVKDLQEQNANQRMIDIANEAVALFCIKYSDCSEYPSALNTQCGLKKHHWVALAQFCGLNLDTIERIDGKDNEPRVVDIQTALERLGGWTTILMLIDTGRT